MIEEHYIELMNREIDRANSPAESAALGKYLESSAEARGYFDQLRELAETFARAGEVAPPPELDRIIMSSIAALDAERAASRERSSVRGLFHPRRNLAYAFAAGVALGLIVMALIFQWPARTSSPGVADLYGAFASRGTAGAVFSVETARLEEPGLSGTIEVRYLEHAVEVVVTLATENETTIEVAPGGEAPLVAFRAGRPLPYGLETNAGHVDITFTGRCDDALLFADERGVHPPVALRLSAAGKVVLDRIIEPERKSSR